MEGTCPSCGRVYDLSVDFLSMGGKAKCPHCLEQLAFHRADPGEAEGGRSADQTLVDSRRRPEQPEVDELGASCARCQRRFKVDTAYLLAGGEARCPHCAEELTIDDIRPTAPPSAGRGSISEEELDEEEANDQEIGRLLDDGEIPTNGQRGDERSAPSPDPYAGLGDLTLPELDPYRLETTDGHPRPPDDANPLGAPRPEPFASDASLADEYDPFGAAGGEDGLLDAKEQLGDREGRDASGLEEVDALGHVFVEALDREVEHDDIATTEVSLETGRSAAAGGTGDWPAPPVPEEPDAFPLEFEAELEQEQPKGADQTVQVSVQWQADQDYVSVQRLEEQERARRLKRAQSQPAETQPFADLASTEDWASAAAAWAKGGFKVEEMPPFIQAEDSDEQPSAEPAEMGERAHSVEPTQPTRASGQRQPATSAAPGPPPGSLEVSDSDIIVLDGSEVDALADLAPASAVARRAGPSQAAVAKPGEVVARAPVGKARARPRPKPAAKPSVLRSLLSNPAILATVLGVVAVAALGLLWVILSGVEDVAGMELPIRDSGAQVVDAPPPGGYNARASAVKHYGLGNRQAHLGRFEEAILEYQRASRLDPGYPHPYRAMGAIYGVLGRARLSASAYETYLRLAPNGPDAARVKQLLARYRAKR